MVPAMSESNGVAPIFDACRRENRAALIGYLPTGYPDVDTSIAAMVGLVESGCDIVEVGIAYSDPGMDGPTIARMTGIPLTSRTASLYPHRPRPKIRASEPAAPAR